MLAEPPLALVSCVDFPQPVTMQAHMTSGNVYIVLMGSAALPREPLVNLVVGTIGVIHGIAARPEGS
jgi:hypothetical protein